MTVPRPVRVCSLPGCDLEAVLQWQRLGSDAEAAAHESADRERRTDAVQYERAMAGLELQELQSKRDRLAEGPCPPRVLDMMDAAIAKCQDEIDGMVDPVPPLTVPPVTVAVFGCAGHAVDADAATKTHEPVCLTAGPCDCSL